MATLISKATGNFTSAGTWSLADSASELDSEAGNTASTTSFVASANFTPGAITVDAIGLKIASRTAGATGTFTVELFNSTGTLSVATVVVNAVDMPLNGGWVIFPIGSTLLLAATNYQVRIKSSVASTVTVYRNATAGNWSRQLRTTTTQSPAAGDKLIIAGEHTGAGTGNNFTVTMDETATTIYGSTSFLQSISVCKRSTLSYGTSASTNYYLKLAGILKVYDSGTFNIGTVGTPIPSTSTAVLEFSVSSNVDSGLEVQPLGTFISQGAAIHTVERALLNADLAATGTSLTTDVSTGWKSGDKIAIAPTARTLLEGESRTLSADASGTTVTITAGASFAHSGSGSTKAEVINLNRNVKIRGTSTSLCAYVFIQTTSVADCDYVEFSFLGSATTNKHGVEVTTSTGSASFGNCSFYDYFNTAGTAAGIYVTGAAANNLNITDCNMWATNYIALYWVTAPTNATQTVTVNGLWAINSFTGTTYGFLNACHEANISNCRISGFGVGVQCNNTAGGRLGSISDCVFHTCTNGLILAYSFEGTASNITCWRCLGQGLLFHDNSRIIIDTYTTFGNTTGAIQVYDNKDCLLKNITSNSNAGFTQPYGVYLSGPNHGTIIYNSSFGSTLGHTTGDIVTTTIVHDIIFHNCVFSSALELSISTWKMGGGYFSQNHQNVTGSHKRVAWEGTSTIDTTIFNTASPSLRMAPAQSLSKLRTPYFTGTVLSGGTIAINAYVRKSVVGDGTAYNGNQPRLIVRANPAAGITSDTVLATASGAAGSWELLSGTTAAVTQDARLEFYIDCDGTTGWINVDDVSFPNEDTSTMKFWSDGSAIVIGDNSIGKFTDPGVANVRLGTSFKFNSTTNNRTGTARIPTVAQVKIGTLYDASDSLTGTYDGSDRWTDPLESNVRLGTAYKANSTSNNKTGNVRVPIISDVRSGVAYDSNDSLVGTYGGGSSGSSGNINVGCMGVD